MAPEISLGDDDSVLEAQLFSNKRINVCLMDSNFLLWKQQVVLTIRGLGLEGCLDGTMPVPAKTMRNRAGETVLNPSYIHYFKQDSSLASWLLSTVSANILPRLVGSETTADVWKSITEINSGLSTTKMMNLHCRLRSLKKGTQTMREYTMAVKEICDLLAACGSKITDMEHIATILNGLPAEFEPSISTITASKEVYTVDNVVSILVDAETRLENTARFSAGINFTRYNTKNPNSSVDNDQEETMQSSVDSVKNASSNVKYKGRPRHQCQLCGKLGHLVDRCWHRFDQNFKGVTAQQSKPKVQVHTCSCCSHSAEQSYDPCTRGHSGHSHVEHLADDNDNVQVNALTCDGPANYAKWFPDSGATHHVASSSSALQNKVCYGGKGKVHLGDGTSLNIMQIGRVCLNSSTRPLCLNNTLYVPQISKNLMSVAQFAQDNHVYFEFHATYCFVKDACTHEVLLKGGLDEGLYSFHDSTADGDMCVHNTVVKDDSEFWTWHRRLGHPSSDVVRLVTHKSVSNSDKHVCMACQMGKSHALPFSSSTAVYSSPFQLVEVDVWGPAPVASNGYRFFVLFVDMYSRNTWLFLLKNKSDVAATFDSFLAIVHNQFHSNVVAFQTDGGGEFRFLESLAVKKGIALRKTCPHTSQQNGVVERKHRHVVEMALALLAQASVPLRFWSQAVVSAVFLINRLPTRTLDGMSPHQRLYGISPDYNFLRVFGCRCYPHLRPFNRHKFDFRSRPCVFLGYSPLHYGYVCLDNDGRCFISQHVVFDEHQFPFATEPVLKSSTSSSVSSGSVPILPVMDSSPSFAPTDRAHDTTVSSGSTRDHLPESRPAPEDQSPVIPPSSSGTAVVDTDRAACDVGTSLNGDDPSMPTYDNRVSPELHDPPPEFVESPVALSHASPVVPTVVTSMPFPTDIEPHISGPDASCSGNTTPIHISQQPQTTMNVHPMVTRRNNGIVKAKVFNVQVKSPPADIYCALDDPDWRAAVMAEYQALISNGTWDIVELPVGRKAVGCKWLFKVKLKADGTVDRFKARLVAKGFAQIPGFDFMDTFSPVVRFATVNILLSVAVSNQWPIRQVDVNNAFLKGDLQEDVYMQQVPGFEEGSSTGKVLVCKLRKALYGLRQAPRNWFAKLKEFLCTLGFVESKADPSLFLLLNGHDVTYLIVYVDDILITGNATSTIDNVISELHNKFSLKDLGLLQFFLGLEVTRSSNGLFLSQKKFLSELLYKVGLQGSNSASTPMPPNFKLSRFDGDPFPNAQLYRSTVGALQYLTHTRPDVAFAVNKAAQFLQHPTHAHWLAVKRILRYLHGTMEFGLWFPSQVQHGAELQVFSDADWGGDIDDRKSISGYCVFNGAHLLTWSSKKQRAVSRSTAEAEYRSLADAAAEITWIRAVLMEMRINLLECPRIWCDNTSAVAMAANPVLHAKTKHFELDLHFVRDKVAAQEIQVNHVPADCQVADTFTKPLPVVKFESLRRKLLVFDVREIFSELRKQ
ncbi:hypothetical protein HRI_000272500 [Hibiscus trionum]|uniref:Integrase catalytic domain-containing protein n=1 Tax=Hibiscus trionum TaxID=183268 RepID=A0A9W7LJ01_HIBTR|nr:hypothetical protein HRI_000272500 [Hibiscus trionum]